MVKNKEEDYERNAQSSNILSDAKRELNLKDIFYFHGRNTSQIYIWE